jgi:hypothetical protein
MQFFSLEIMIPGESRMMTFSKPLPPPPPPPPPKVEKTKRERERETAGGRGGW